MYKDQYPKLRYVLAAYFHENWLHEYSSDGLQSSFDVAVRSFKGEEPPATVAQATNELAEFVKLPLSDEELEKVVAYDLGCAYYPPGDGRTYRQWLESVLNILKEPQDKARSSPVVR